MVDGYISGLSLCAGVGGLDLGFEIAFPGFRTIAAVENNPEAALRFKRRFPQAKVFRDVLGFDGRPLHGRVDCILAGWPCQPHSVAGKRQGTADERWIWGDIARIIGETGTPIFAGENVQGLLRDTGSDSDAGPDELDESADDLIGGMGTVLRDLAALGFVVAWGSLRAADVGASHGRPRVFVLAVQPSVLQEHAAGARCDGPAQRERYLGGQPLSSTRSGDRSAGVGLAHAQSGGLGIDGSAPGECGHPEQRDEKLAGVIQDDAQRPERRPCDAQGGCGSEGRDRERQAAGGPELSGEHLADAGCGLLPQPGRGSQGRNGSGPAGEVLADAEREPGGAEQFAHQRERAHRGALDRSVLGDEGVGLADACQPRLPRPEPAELSGAQPEHQGRTTEQLRGALLEDPAWASVPAGSGGSGRRRGVCGTGDYLEAFGLFAPGPSDPLWRDVLAARPDLAPALSPVTKLLAEGVREGWLLRLAGEVAEGVDVSEETLTGVHGSSHGVARWLVERRARLQCGGNGVVPLQAAVAFRVLARRLGLI